MTDSSIYDQIAACVKSDDRVTAVNQLIEHLDSQKLYHEQFEALKMRMRLELGLTPAQAENEDRLDEETELKIERGLLDACRVIAGKFFQQGNIREGWMYMRPVGDRQEAAKALQSIEPNEENVDEFLEVLLHEGVDIRRGYQLALKQLGTCNSITMFESALAARPRSDQEIAAELLVHHVHGELLENLQRDIEQRESNAPAESTLAELLAARPDLLKDGTYHLDTSHIASTVRFARVLNDEPSLQLALDIATYGLKLHPQFQYPGEEPFLDLYPASVAFFRALLGQQVDQGIRYFSQKADTLNPEEQGTVAIEVLIDLLSRCGRQEDALANFHKRLPPGCRTMGIAPSLLQISQRLGNFDSMIDVCKQREDLLGYAAAILQAPEKSA
ncbi:MAG: hypothetical protein AAGG44_06410 [Planctomycetota bacterium]